MNRWTGCPSWAAARCLPAALALLLIAPAGCPDEGDPVDPADTPTTPDTPTPPPDTPADTVEPHVNSTVDPDAHDHGVATAFDPDAIAEDAALFPMGVQAGATKTESVILWGFADDQQPKTLRVWRASDAAGQVVLVKDEVWTPAEGFFKQTVVGLAPATEYRYAFFAGDAPDFTARSLIGRFETAFPEDWIAPVTVAGTVGLNHGHRPFDALSLTAEYDYHVLAHVGDWSYNDVAHDRAAYRDHWRGNLSDPGYRAVLAHAAHYGTWDDHEIANNDEWETLSPEKFEAGKEAWFEHVAVPRFEGDRFWDSYRWGRSVEFFVLDLRGERQPETRGTDDEIFISRAQMDWLKRGLEESPCHFKAVLVSLPITWWPEKWIWGYDRWQGYAIQRAELLDHIVDKEIKNVWWLAGDFHVGAVCRVAIDGPHRRMWEILLGPGGCNGNPLQGLTEVDPSLTEEIYPAAQFEYHSGKHAANLITFDPATDSVRIQFIHAYTRDVLYDEVLSQTW